MYDLRVAGFRNKVSGRDTLTVELSRTLSNVQLTGTRVLGCIEVESILKLTESMGHGLDTDRKSSKADRKVKL